MRLETFPLAMPADLLTEVRNTAKTTGLSMSDTMRQSMKLGLGQLREKLSAASGRVTNVDPLPDRVLDRLYREREDDDASIRRFIAAQPRGPEAE